MHIPIIFSTLFYLHLFTWVLLHSPAFYCTFLRFPALSCALLRSPLLSCALLHSPALSCTLLRSPAFSCAYLHSPGLSWALLGSPGLSWALLGSSALFCAVLRSPGLSWALLHSPGVTCAILHSPVLSWSLLVYLFFVRLCMCWSLTAYCANAYTNYCFHFFLVTFIYLFSCILLCFLHYLVLSKALLSSPALSCALLHSPVLSCALLHSLALSCAFLCSPVLSCALLRFPVLFCALLRSPALSWAQNILIFCENLFHLMGEIKIFLFLCQIGKYIYFQNNNFSVFLFSSVFSDLFTSNKHNKYDTSTHLRQGLYTFFWSQKFEFLTHLKIRDLKKKNILIWQTL